MKIIRQALLYHQFPQPGKIEIKITKNLNSTKHIKLAYTPGVAYPVIEINKNLNNIYKYTAKGNLVAIISNGTAILGLGNLGPEASKPVMEGKAILFKYFSNIDAFDIEIKTKNYQKFIETVINISPTFGGINLEDIKAPECFEIEKILKNKLKIPIFHDDQHGTAIIITSALLNSLFIQQKKIKKCKIVLIGAGAAGIATAKLLLKTGIKKQNINIIDTKGIINKERTDLNIYKKKLATKTNAKKIEDIIKKIDIIIGVASANILSIHHIKNLKKNTIVFALSNPNPEINPIIIYKNRPDIILATGRSDYKNQVNNALCFPYIFKGLLNLKINFISCYIKKIVIHSIKNIARKSIKNKTQKYKNINFGNKYIIPLLTDKRLKIEIPLAIKNKISINQNQNLN
ncbi:MAG TPA: malic enzyme-like NAD(P)-binding protein [Candidatus Azosocius sp. HAIN]